ncbi:MAG: ATP-binding protein [Terriglobales bacterium]|jgi:signal transduction histidine kinase
MQALETTQDAGVNTLPIRTALMDGLRQTNEITLNVLMVEDSEADQELVLRELRRSGFAITSALAQTAEEFANLVHKNVPDVVLADYNLGHWRGIEAVEILRKEGMDVPVILVSGALGDINAVECIKQGATDYVLKDSLARLPIAIRRALREKQIERERMQAQRDLACKLEELARSNRDLEQFAYVASHDLQEPLRMVAAYTQLLAEQYRDHLDEKAQRYIHYAVDGAIRMQTLIQDLLAFSRCGRSDMGSEISDCNLILQRALDRLTAAIEEARAHVTWDPLPVLPVNRSQMEHVFQNLISNAIKFRGKEPPVVHVSAHAGEGAWEFAVSDNGIGIAPENADLIFAVFKRLHTREEYPGNGIGLSLCKKIIERHGGTIWVGSSDHNAEVKAGSGTTIRFTLPTKTQEPNS